MTDTWAKLAAPFPASELDWRVGQKSKAGTSATLFAYLTARAVMDRLDDVVGPDCWRDSYTPVLKGGDVVGYFCTLELFVEGNGWVGKADVADLTDMEALKGGVSSALKRAAVKWGLGRYLYGLDNRRYYPIVKGYGKDDVPHVYCAIGEGKGGEAGHILIPKLPDWALPPAHQGPTARDRMIERIELLEEAIGEVKTRLLRAGQGIVCAELRMVGEQTLIAYGKALKAEAERTREPGEEG